MMSKQIKKRIIKKPIQQEWVGEILTKKQQKVYKNNGFQGNIYYKLIANKADESRKQAIFVYPNIVSKEIIDNIEKENYIYKKYFFTCERAKWGWILHNWQELKAYEKK